MSKPNQFNLLTFLLKSIRYHGRLYVGLFLSVIVTSTIITGALLVGDSLRHTLRSLSQERLGSVQLVMPTLDRFFRQDLAKRIGEQIQVPATSAIRINSVAINPELTRRAHKVNVFGVESEFWGFGNADVPFSHGGDEVVINQKLANKLGVKFGEQILIRFETPGHLSKDSVLASTENIIDARRFTVSRILSAKEFGNFSLEANQLVPYNIFISLDLLQKYLNKNKEANLLIVGGDNGKMITVDDAKSVFNQVWRLNDFGLTLKEYPQKGVVELQSDRVFIDHHIERVASSLTPNRKIFTYFVNEIRNGDSVTPYSMVAAVDTHSHESINSGDDWSQFFLDDDAIILNQWCADDLDAEIGDTITLRYLVPEKRRPYTEKETSFILKSILPISNANIDNTLTPTYPGLVDSESCQDWDTGIPIELNRIRSKDEVYWDKYQATPKAVISFARGKAIWQNRFGNITAIRYPSSIESKTDIEARLQDSIRPDKIGFNFRSVKIDAVNAATGSTDFSGLFIGLSFFIIAAALLLTGLLFAFSVEYKSEEQGILRALGFTKSHIKTHYLIESFLISVPAACVGIGLGLGYTKLILYGLATLWRDAIIRTPLMFHIEKSSLIIGVISSVILTIIVVSVCLSHALKRPVILLLNRVAFVSRLSANPGGKLGAFLLFVSLVTAVVSFVFIQMSHIGSMQEATGFFVAGMFGLVSCITFAGFILIRIERLELASPNLTMVAIRNLARHKGRSLAILGILACAAFLLMAMETQKLTTSVTEGYINAGTGGFTLMGQATHPIYDDATMLFSSTARSGFPSINVISMSMVDGDDASCLNLNRAQQPGIVGINSEEFGQHSSFKFKSFASEQDHENPWTLLNKKIDDNTIPVIADFNTMTYALGKKLGDVIVVQAENGTNVSLQFAATLKNSILQGMLLINEQHLIDHFPSNSGYRMFLVKSDETMKSLVMQSINDSFQDHGLEMINTVDRLNELNQVQNTYISIFQVLGGLGILLGSIGLGIILFRHAQERRSEFAIMTSLGFRRSSILWMLVKEHCVLILLGTLTGAVAAFIALFPRLSIHTEHINLMPILLLIVSIIVNGFIWVWLASFFTLRQDTLKTLRRE